MNNAKPMKIAVLILTSALLHAPARAGAAPDQGHRLNGGVSICYNEPSSSGGAHALWWLRYVCWALN